MNVSELDLDGAPPKPTRPPPRFFLAHAKSCNGIELDTWVAAARVLLDRFSKGKPYKLTLGRDHYEARFKQAGSWEAWALEVATGVDYLTRRPVFDAILVPFGYVGAATATILREAIGATRPVYVFDLQSQWAFVVGVKRVSGSWQTGHALVIDRALRP